MSYNQQPGRAGLPKRFSCLVIAGVLLVLLVGAVLLLGYLRSRTAPTAGPAVPTGGPTRARVPPDPNLALGDPSGATADASDRDNYLLVKPQYVLSYSDGRGGPNWVSWSLRASDIGDVGRQNNFHPESALPRGFKRVTPDDYTGSGFDRGHVCNSKDRTATAADNSETFSMANMLPQTPDLNRHVWEGLESYSRTLAQQGAELYIVAGGYGSAGQIGRANKVTVPTNCWKIVVVFPGGQMDLTRVDAATRVIAVDMPNVQGIALDPWAKYVTTVADIEAKTGYRFFTELPEDVQRALKSKRDAGR
jgi:endonuclease G